MSAEPDFGMTDLEEALRGPDGATVRRDAIERLGRISERLEVELAGGASPQAYDRLTAMQTAVTTATRIFAATSHQP